MEPAVKEEVEEQEHCDSGEYSDIHTNDEGMDLSADKSDHGGQRESGDYVIRSSDILDRGKVEVEGCSENIEEEQTDDHVDKDFLAPENSVKEGLSIVRIDESVGNAVRSSKAAKMVSENLKSSNVEVVEMMLVKEEEVGDLADEPRHTFSSDYNNGGDDAGTIEEQEEFLMDLTRFYRERGTEFRSPKFYKEDVNCLKLWRQVTGLGGYDQVTACKLWRQVGESFDPPKTCTTISWTFRNFYEKALLDYEKYKIQTGEFLPAASAHPDHAVLDSQVANQVSVSGRARRESATRAMQGWHTQRLLSNGEIGDPIIKDKCSISLSKKDKNQKSSDSLKRKKTFSLDHEDALLASKADTKKAKTMVVDIGSPADWVKINVRKTKDCYEIYALVPGLLREEVHVQLDPAGRLIISGAPEHSDNLWGVTPFKKVVSLPSRIDPHNSSAVVTLHGQLFVRAPFEQAKA